MPGGYLSYILWFDLSEDVVHLSEPLHLRRSVSMIVGIGELFSYHCDLPSIE